MRTFAKRIASALARRAPRGLKLGVVALGERALGRQRWHGSVPGLSGARYRLTIPGHRPPFVVCTGPVVVAGWAIDLAAGRPLPVRARTGSRTVAAAVSERSDLVAAFSRICELPLRCGIDLEIPVRAGPSLVVIEAEVEPGRWSEIQKLLVLARPGAAPAWRYSEVLSRRLAADLVDAGEQRDYARSVQGRPSFVVILDTRHGGDRAATLASLAEQTYGPPRVVAIGEGGEAEFASALVATAEDFVLPLRAGDRLDASALYAFASAAHADPDLEIVYADEDCDEDGAPAPFFKPDWSPDTLESFNYLGAPAAFRGDLARAAGAESAYDLALHMTDTAGRVVHLASVLCRRAVAATRSLDEASDRDALGRRLARTGRTGRVHTRVPGLACYDCKVDVEGEPLVSIVIPTAGKEIDIGGRHIDLVVDCIRSIRSSSSYRRLEFIVVKNDDLPAAKEARLVELGCKVIPFGEPVFNVAKKLNLGIREATGEFIILMNDDIEVVAPDWIERLLAQAQKPHVGVVGAKLIYPHGDLQHAGVVILYGNPDHVRHHYPRADLGYLFSTVAPRNYMAVTGACMMGRADVVRRVGGYTEALAVSFNDVDFCLKIRELGLQVVYEPGCELIHFESVSRTLFLNPAELELFRARWGAVIARDPFYNAAAFAVRPPAFEPFMGVEEVPGLDPYRIGIT